MRIWKNCIYYYKNYCSYYKSKFNGTFECKGICFDHKHKKIKGDGNFKEIISGGDHVL